MAPSKTKKELKNRVSFSKFQVIVLALAFGLIGGYALYSSFAANGSLPGDLNNDGVVSLPDLTILLANWRTTNPTADINNDGIVDTADLSVLLSHYGQTGGTGGISVAPPAPPQSYTIPSGATLVSNSAQLKTALANGVANIELANGTYSDSSYFSDWNSSSLYAQNLGGAVFTTGVTDGGNFGPGGATIEGLAFNMTDNSLGFQGAEIDLWGATGVNARILDDTFEGNYDMDYGIYGLSVSGLIAQRLVFSHFHADAFVAYNNITVSYNSPTDIINSISDISIDGVHEASPGSSNGTAEAGLWVGQPVTNGVHRIKVRNVLWSGIETVNNSWNTTFSDLDIDETGMGVGVAVYMEHFTEHDTFTNFIITGTHDGFNSEWDDGTAGNAAGHFNTIQNGSIDALGASDNSHSAGIFLDEGSESTTVTGVTFKNQSWAGIGAYLNTGTNNFSNNTYQLLAGGVQTSTGHL